MLLHQVVIHFSVICQLVTYGRLKIKKNLKVVINLQLLTLTRGSKYMYSDLTGKLLVFWKTEERCLLMRGGCN